jgi:hypothetical protein
MKLKSMFECLPFGESFIHSELIIEFIIIIINECFFFPTITIV